MITETTVEQMRERHKKEIEDFQANEELARGIK
jgi:hypothetical protein